MGTRDKNGGHVMLFNDIEAHMEHGGDVQDSFLRNWSRIRYIYKRLTVIDNFFEMTWNTFNCLCA